MQAAQKVSPKGRSAPSQKLRLAKKKQMITKYLPLVRSFENLVAAAQLTDRRQRLFPSP
jgi:hypothetical protein